MFTFASYVLHSYYRVTGWNEDNLYSNLTRSSSAILDFTVPQGLNFSISKSPNPLFKTTYSMNALPSLNGSIAYVFTSRDLNIPESGSVRFKDMVDRFKVYTQPRRPEGKDEEWLSGRRVDTRDYLMYGRLYIPSGRLDAMYSTRLSPTLQAVIAAISDPLSSAPSTMSERSRGNNTGQGLSNLMLSLQQDIGRWCSEYTWSADDGMLGVRVLRNFGKLAAEPDDNDERTTSQVEGRKRVDEEEAMEGGLKGRLSAGAELYFSAKERSAGVSTGIRFTTLPDATPPSSTFNTSNPPTSPQPPTTITAIFNPMMGHISTAYAARVSRDLSLCTRFDFNVYSYESEWTTGLEWWMRQSPVIDDATKPMKLSTADGGTSMSMAPVLKGDRVQGVVKARISTNTDISLMWEGRLHNILVSLGVVSDLASRSKPIRAVGLELSYFSSG